MDPFTWIVTIILLVLIYLMFFKTPGVVCPTDFWKWEYCRGQRVYVRHVFIECRDKEEARQRAKEMGRGAEPEHHGPHKYRSDFYWHYHPANHDLIYDQKDNTWKNYHFFYGPDCNGKYASDYGYSSDSDTGRGL